MIAPSILSADFGNLAREIAQIEAAGADMIHLDVMDGHYVPNLTFGYPIIQKVKQLCTLPLDVHLMVTSPSSYIGKLAEIGVAMVSFHQECDYHSHRLIQNIKSKGMKAGLALNPGTPLSGLEYLLSDLDYVLLMSVNPGFSGQSFIMSVLDKVVSLRTMISASRANALIEVDGGITKDNSAALIDSGADILVSASYIFKSTNYKTAIDSLRHYPLIH